MSDTPSPGNEDRTVSMTAPSPSAVPSSAPTRLPPSTQAVAAPPVSTGPRWLLYAGAGIVLIASLAGGAWLVLRDKRPDASSQPARTLPPFSPTRMVDEVFEGRDRGHAVTASVETARVRIGQDSLRFSISSAKPGHVYVLAVGSNQSDFDLLFPNTVDPNNRIGPGETLTLPRPLWPVKAQGPPGTSRFVAIVSDEPRDFSDLAPPPDGVFQKFPLTVAAELYLHHTGANPLFAGKVVCASATPCSASYGAVVFSIEQAAGGSEARDPEIAPRAPVAAPRAPAAPTPTAPRAPTTGPTPAAPRAPAAPAARDASPPPGAKSALCSDLLHRASLGDPLTDEEQTILRRDCR